jgi:hypothetical protein
MGGKIERELSQWRDIVGIKRKERGKGSNCGEGRKNGETSMLTQTNGQ